MARTERETIAYKIEPHGGPAELDTRTGKSWNGEQEDEPWTYTLVRVAKTEVQDGRGRNWQAGTSVDEVLATLNARQVATLIGTAAEALSWAPDSHNDNLAILAKLS